jgi:hypothetical protein
MKWSNGKHPYRGKNNGRGKRKKSKMLKGLKINYRGLNKAFIELEKERL